MTDLCKITVVIPSLNPDEKLSAVICGVKEKGFTDILLVDDGSCEEKQHYFQEAEQLSGCTVLHHPKNMGKGRALKTAFAWILENRPDAAGCVTIDGDGQHHADDIFICTEQMLMQDTDAVVLGVRNFDLETVPPKSKLGNKCTALVFRAFFDLKISDTQTGLRVFPRRVLPEMLKISGERFEYETNMLLYCKQAGIPLKEQQIQTIYMNDNSETHFHPVKDSLRVYGTILKFSSGSFLPYLLDLILFNVLNVTLKNAGVMQHLFLAAALARIVSALCQLIVCRKAVFRSAAPRATTVARFYILWAVKLLLSYGLTACLSSPFGDSTAAQGICKLIADLILNVIGVRVQHRWVFRSGKEPSGQKE